MVDWQRRVQLETLAAALYNAYRSPSFKSWVELRPGKKRRWYNVADHVMKSAGKALDIVEGERNAQD